MSKAPLLEPVRDVSLQPSQPAADESIAMFERLARDPNASVEKISGLMDLWERMQAKKAESEFNASMSAAQKAMRPIAADAYNPQTKSKYASYAQLDGVLRPIYTEHGFGLSFNTVDSPLAEHVRVVCKATHSGGHSELYRLDMPADGKGAKGGDVMTKTHATGSALTYGQRYLLKMIFNVAVGDELDDDGNAAGDKAEKKQIPEPAGAVQFREALAKAATDGSKALYACWNGGEAKLRQHVTRAHRDWWAQLRESVA